MEFDWVLTGLFAGAGAICAYCADMWWQDECKLRADARARQEHRLHTQIIADDHMSIAEINAILDNLEKAQRSS